MTNTFENKTAAAMAQISPNLFAVDPSVDAVADGLRRAAATVDDFDRRVQGSDVRWSRDWGRSFPEALLGRLEHWLELRR